MTKKQSAERDEAIVRLRETLKLGDTVWTDLKHVSRSGMQRVIQLLAIENNQPRYLGWNAAKAMGYRYDEKREGIVIGGCGMDMGFSLVYDLAHTLWPKGYECTGQKCCSNDHSNGDRNYEPHLHKDSGYALNHRWL
jgi:hypothetical protein